MVKKLQEILGSGYEITEVTTKDVDVSLQILVKKKPHIG